MWALDLWRNKANAQYSSLFYKLSCTKFFVTRGLFVKQAQEPFSARRLYRESATEKQTRFIGNNYNLCDDS